MTLLMCCVVAMTVMVYMVTGQPIGHGAPQFDCHTYQFTCTDGSRKIPSRLLCDGDANCADGSDEIKENCVIDCVYDGPKINVDCSIMSFTCANGRMASIFELCDGYPHCSDGSDEVAANCQFDCPMAPGSGAWRRPKTRKKRFVPLPLLKFLFFRSAGTMDQIGKMLRGEHNTTPSPGDIM